MLTVLACCSSQISYTANEAALVEDVEAVAPAVNAAAGCQIVTVKGAGEPLAVVIRKMPSNLDGHYDVKRGEIELSASIADPSVRRRIIVHETGHALGLDHEDGTVMAEYTPRTVGDDNAYGSLAELLHKYRPDLCARTF